MPETPRRSALPLRVALAVASVAAVLVLGELFASSIGGRASFRGLHVVRPDAPWLYELAPGATARDDTGVTYRIGANGFRDVEREAAKPAGVFRVAVLGDSVAFGYGVAAEDVFTRAVEARLGETSGGPPIEVLNFAVSGYNPYNEAELYRGVVRDYAPDLVLVQFCINDLNDPTLHFGASTMKRLGKLPDLAFPNARAARTAARRPGSLVLACERSSLCALVFGSWVASGRGPQNADEWRTGFEIREGEAFAAEWAWLRDRYADIAESVRADGAAFGILAFPYAAEIGTDETAADSATARLAALGRTEGWEVVDLLPALRRAPADGAPLFLDIWHPTPLGHDLAAAEIARALRCRGMVPRPAPPGCG